MEKYDKILELMNQCGDSPKVTIMLPTHRKSPENKQDKIIFKNLVQEAKNILENKYSPTTYKIILDRLNILNEDSVFWSHASKGLVVLACNNGLDTFKLNKPIKSQVKVSDIFDLRPILAYQESLGDHFLVDLAKDRFKLYIIRDKEIQEMNDHEIKNSFTELFDDFDDEGNLNVGRYGGIQGMYHGHIEKSVELKKDRIKFFRYLDREFSDLHKDTQSHFFFAGTIENINTFKGIAQKNFYHDLSIVQPLSSLNKKTLDKKIEKITYELKEEAIQNLRKEINDAYNSHKVIDTYEDIISAINEGKVSKLFIKGNLAYNNNYDRLLYLAVSKKIDSCVIDEDKIELKSDLIALTW